MDLSSSSNRNTAYKTERKYHLANAYGDNRISLLVRDPWTLYSYWEIKREVEDSVRNRIGERGLTPEKSVLRVYDVTGKSIDEGVAPAFDFELRDWVNTWYIHTGNHGRAWMVEVGILCTNGEFFCLARSNVVTTPVYGMSDTVDDQWKCPEDLFYKMFAVAGGHDIGKSSLMMREQLERHLREWLFSGERGIGISSAMFGSASFHLFPRK